jgi:hypothetical protein
LAISKSMANWLTMKILELSLIRKYAIGSANFFRGEINNARSSERSFFFITREFEMRLMQKHVDKFGTLLAQYIFLFEVCFTCLHACFNCNSVIDNEFPLVLEVECEKLRNQNFQKIRVKLVWHNSGVRHSRRCSSRLFKKVPVPIGRSFPTNYMSFSRSLDIRLSDR